MSNLKHYIEGIKNGEGFFDEAFKLNVILNALCIIHAVYAILLFAFGYSFLGAYAVGTAVFYQLLRLLIQKSAYKTIIILSIAEVWLFSSINEIFLGRACSFAFLILGTIPGVFYFALTWNIYKNNYKNNPIADDRLRHDVLFHTDLNRTHGQSNGNDLAFINWGNYDLVVIDESHNFRNKSARSDRETRYSRLMERVMKA